MVANPLTKKEGLGVEVESSGNQYLEWLLESEKETTMDKSR